MGLNEFLNNCAGLLFLLLVILIIVLIVLVILVLKQNRALKKKYERFMRGKDGTSLETNLIKRVNDIENLIAKNKENEKNIEKISQELTKTFHKVGIVKYDAFNESGGKLSFSLALLNQENDGFIINAMHSREGCYTYIKEIIKGNPIVLLSSEEKEALEMAKK